LHKVQHQSSENHYVINHKSGVPVGGGAMASPDFADTEKRTEAEIDNLLVVPLQILGPSIDFAIGFKLALSVAVQIDNLLKGCLQKKVLDLLKWLD
jgi:hypothetical protein